MPAEKACPTDEMLPPGVVCPLWLPFTNDLDDMRGCTCTLLTCHCSFFSL